mmetsp:Transcript_2287/g.3832  ORF Transcript_2287/g.3832 Transcript_2287/m.3832 type:complete len:116 (+) Transcript_2287:450-797(+)
MIKVLGGLANGFDAMKKMGTIGEDEAELSDDNDDETPDAAKVSELLLTLRDFVSERIDYATRLNKKCARARVPTCVLGEKCHSLRIFYFLIIKLKLFFLETNKNSFAFSCFEGPH